MEKQEPGTGIRFLLVSNMYPGPEQQQYGVFVRNIEDGLVRNGVAVDRIVISGRGFNWLAKIRKYCRYYWHLLRAPLNRYDVVQVGYPSHSYLPFLLKSLGRTKLVVRLHGLDLLGGPEDTFLLRVSRLFTRLAVRRADLVVVPSRYFADELRKRHPVKRIYIYPSGGVDLDLFYPAPKPSENPVVSAVGRLDRFKGVDVLIRALTKTRHPVRARIVGDGPLRAEWEALARQLGVPDRVQFTGAVPHEELTREYQATAAFVFPTVRPAESFGNVAVEAMACGLPVIGSRIAGLTEYIRENENGLFVEPGNVEDLASAMDRFFELSRERRLQMRKAAIQTAVSFERYEVTAGFVAELRHLLDQPGN